MIQNNCWLIPSISEIYKNPREQTLNINNQKSCLSFFTGFPCLLSYISAKYPHCVNFFLDCETLSVTSHLSKLTKYQNQWGWRREMGRGKKVPSLKHRKETYTGRITGKLRKEKKGREEWYKRHTKPKLRIAEETLWEDTSDFWLQGKTFLFIYTSLIFSGSH